MFDAKKYVRETAEAIGLNLPEERQAAVAEAVEAALRQVESIRDEQTPVPAPTPFDASWSDAK